MKTWFTADGNVSMAAIKKDMKAGRIESKDIPTLNENLTAIHKLCLEWNNTNKAKYETTTDEREATTKYNKAVNEYNVLISERKVLSGN